MLLTRSEQLRDRIAARLRAYEERYSFIREERASAETVVRELEASVGYYWPCSAVAVLRALWWTLTHPSPQAAWWREVDILLHVLNVSREPRPGAIGDWARKYGEDNAAEWRRTDQFCVSMVA